MPEDSVHVFARCGLNTQANGELRIQLSLTPRALGAGGACALANDVVDENSIVLESKPKVSVPVLETGARSQKRTLSFSRRILGAASKSVASLSKSLTPRSSDAEQTPRERKRRELIVEFERPSRTAPLDVTLADVQGVGVVVASMKMTSLAAQGGLRPGDVLLTCGSWPIEYTSDAYAVMKRVLGSVEMTVSRLEGNGLPRGWKAASEADGAAYYWRMVKGTDGKLAPHRSTVHPVALPPSQRLVTEPTPRGPLSEIRAQ